MTYRAVKYPGPRDPVTEWADKEHQAIEKSFSDLDFIQIKRLNVAPAKPRNGMIVLADGTNWNPGAGQGYYGYYGGAWNKLG